MRKQPAFLLRQTALHRMLMQYHPIIGQLYVPGLNARVPFEGGGYYVRTNRQGFRANADFQPRKQGRPRILFFGDSFTDGFGVSNHERFSDLIGEALGAEVFNYGLSGSGTDQQLLIYETFAAEVEADLLVFGILVENIERIQRSHHYAIDRYAGRYVYFPKPYFTLNGEALTLHHSPVPRERLTEPPASADAARGGAPSTRQRLLHALRGFYYHPRLAALRPNQTPAIVDDSLRANLLKLAQYQPYPDYLAANTPGWQLMAAILRRFIRQAGSVPVLIVPIPDSFFYRTTPLRPVYQQRFESLADPAHPVHVVDLTARLNQLPPEDKARLPFEHDFHFSPYGHAQVAKIVTEEIAQRGLLPRAPTVSYRRPRPRPNGRTSGAHTPDTYILGISCFYHNAAACLIKNGQLVAAAEEERFTRIKHDRNFPHRAINYCLEEGGIQQNDLAAVVYYDNAYQTFERLLHTQLALGPAGREAWQRVIPSWLQYKLSIPALIRRYMRYTGRVLHADHHRSHAASAFYPSPFERAAILTIDGVGEWATASISVGRGSTITPLKEMHFPHSVGLLYSAFTQFCGFQVNDAEYKLMGLAPYGEPRYVDAIYEHLVDLKPDGSIELNLDYFAFLGEPTMTNDRFAALFGGPARHPKQPVTQRERDLARSVQVVTEDIVMRMARHAHTLTGAKYLCLAGGVALNCVANGRLLREGPFEDLWIQPAAGDAGCALGAALDVWHTYLGQPRAVPALGQSPQAGSLWGPEYSDAEIRAFLDSFAYPYHQLAEAERADTVAAYIEAGKVVGHFAGRLEYGPRALGARSILGDARSQEMQSTLNLKIKYRESFRPFAPTVLAECAADYFDIDRESPYMLLVADVRPERRLPFKIDPEQGLYETVRQPRSDLPAITHVDYSARLQTLNRAAHPQYYDVIEAFRRRTGYGVIVNTSFNVRGEPIVCSPYDAYRCFMRTDMDVLVMGPYLLLKAEQPPWPEEKGHDEHYDPSVQPGPAASSAAAALTQVFDSDFLPLAVRLPSRIPLTFQRQPSTWLAPPQPRQGAELFDIPPALDTDPPAPAPMAQAMLQFWQPGETTDALAPVVEKLLAIGCEQLALQPDEEAVETVSDFVYVMY